VVSKTQQSFSGKPKATGEWRPTWAMLPCPEALERLSQPGGVPVQQRLWADALPDDTRQGRLARLLVGVPGVVTGDRLTPTTHRGHTSPGGYGLDRCCPLCAKSSRRLTFLE